MKNIFTLNQCHFPSSSIQLSLTVPVKSFYAGELFSEPVSHEELSWRVYFRTRMIGGRKLIGISLRCESLTGDKNWRIPARYQVTLKNYLSDDYIKESPCSRFFTCEGPSWSWPSFALWEDVMDPTKGFLKDNSFSISAKIAFY